MGDHRADIKIEFTIHGKTYKQDCWINWCPDSDGVDARIKEWFSGCWDDAYARYSEQMDAYFQREHAAEIEKAERAELARLATKYAGCPTCGRKRTNGQGCADPFHAPPGL